jgi:drug/metabolite transporter (DMT)-like permease
MKLSHAAASFKKNRTGIFLMLLSSLFVCAGQLCWKLSHTKGVYFLIAGFVLYTAGASIMLIAYKYGSLSVLQPVLSLNYIFAVIFAYLFFNEVITATKLAGVSIIMIGVSLICVGDET